ncbi:MAG: hypothetical protein KJ043_21380, partial [Anaerolineae bacterium]|nr:hypothetical protein [Anaerolineae bacterium]
YPRAKDEDGKYTGEWQITPTDKLALTAVAERLGEWALMLKLANKTIRQRVELGESLPDAFAYLNRKLDEQGFQSLTDPDNPNERHRTADACLSVSADLLTSDQRAYFHQLAIFPEDTNIPLTTLAQLWGMNMDDVEALCAVLYKLSLLLSYNLKTRTIRLHDVVREHLRRTQKDHLYTWNSQLITSWVNVYALPDNYAWHNIAYHLIDAWQTDRLRGLLLDHAWLDAKLHATDANLLITDCGMLLEQGKDEPIRLIQSALNMSAHVLDKDKKALAHQLAGRLMHHYTKVDEIRIFLDIVMTTPHNLFPLDPTSDYDIMNPAGGMMLRTMKHKGVVRGAMQLGDGRVLSWSDNVTLRLWDSDGHAITELTGHKGNVHGAMQLGDGRLLSWSKDTTLRLWDSDGHAITELTGHKGNVRGAMQLGDGRLLSWSKDTT